MTNTQRHHVQLGDNDIILHKAQAEILPKRKRKANVKCNWVEILEANATI